MVLAALECMNNGNFEKKIVNDIVLDVFIICQDIMTCTVGLSDLRITCSLRNSRFAGLNPAEVNGFFQDVKILSTSPPGETLSWGSRV